MRTHEPAEFLSRLSNNDLPDPAELSVSGMVKADENDPSVISFTQHVTCEKWLSLPMELVASITHLKNIACRDHEHPLVTVKFKHPEETGRELGFLLSLCAELQTSLSRVVSSVEKPTEARRSKGEDASRPQADCRVVGTPEGIVVCCIYPGGTGTDFEVECTGIG